MGNFSAFAYKTCEDCGLAHFCTDAGDELQIHQPIQKALKIRHHNLQDLPKSHVADNLEDPLLSWDASYGRFVIISDCKPLVQIINGYSPLANPSLLPFFHRVSNHLASILDSGFFPSCIHDDPVIWRRRDFNKKADYLANHTMDKRKSWHQVCRMPFPNLKLIEANFIIHFDGGTRGDDCSASAWILEGRMNRGGDLVEFPIAYCGKFLSPPVSSFLAEAIALESCIEFLSKLVLKVLETEPPHKRARLG